jgi:hypothetical protein
VATVAIRVRRMAKKCKFLCIAYKRPSNEHVSQYGTTLYVKAKSNSRTRYSNILNNSFLWPYKLHKSVDLDAFFVGEAAI